MKINKRSQEWHDCMQHAFMEAADAMQAWEYGGASTKEEKNMQDAAGKEVAKLIRKMADRRNIAFAKRHRL